VEAEVLALRLFNPDKIPADRVCSWLGLEVKNTKTGKREAYFDNADDSDALLKMMKQFGTIPGDYVLIDSHRRQWSYGLNLFLPRSGKGQRRHYDHTLPLGSRKYVDATEPRWLIQDIYPPKAVSLATEIARTAKKFEHAQNMARGNCRMAIERATGNRIKDPDMKHAACGLGSATAVDLKDARYFDAQLKILRQIK
ncbi:MAG: hypothetical protein O9249_00750, partial [Burkholderiaceae bacterium]|nr:hypothetical protein [Burkholderiaceae bacterium]